MNRPLDDGAVLPRPLRREFSGRAGGKRVADA